MRQTRLEYLADRLEVLDEEIRDHEAEARRHQHMATQKRKQLEIALEQYYTENATDQAALPAYTFNNVSTAIVTDYERNSK